MLSEHEAARILNLSVRTLQADRVKGGRIPFCKIGRRVCYRPEDIEKVTVASVVLSTSDVGRPDLRGK